MPTQLHEGIMNWDRREILSELRGINDYEFEQLIADIWEHRGWSTSVTPGSGDRGIDVIARKSHPFDQKQLLQAKRHSAGNKVGSPDVERYNGLRHREDGVDSVIIVTTSSFTAEAQRTAKDLNVKLLSGEDLVGIIIEDCPESLLSEYLDTSEHKKIGGRGSGTDTGDSIYPRSFQRGSKTKIFGEHCPMCGEKSSIRAGKTVNTDPLLLCEGCGTKWAKKEVKDGLLFGPIHVEWSAIGKDQQMKTKYWEEMNPNEE